MTKRINIWQKPNPKANTDHSTNPNQQNNTNKQNNTKATNEPFTAVKTMEDLIAEQNARLQETRQKIADSYQQTHQNVQNTTQPLVEDEESQSDEEEMTTADLLNQLRRNGKQTQPKHIPRSQRRGRFCLSVSVSEEDELVFRAAAAAQDMTFSEWSRKAMYKYAKIKPPKRHKK